MMRSHDILLRLSVTRWGYCCEDDDSLNEPKKSSARASNTANGSCENIRSRLIIFMGGGAFVLFTSFSMLNRAAEMLRPILVEEGYPLLVHGQDGPRGLLLRRFRDDERSVLLGTTSFWQGVDVRGRGLRNVIVTRLPFEVPDRPLLEARCERIRERGGDPFREDQFPKAVIRFKQGIGRLIRSTTDAGRIVVLDPRIATKPYGRKFLEALPEGVRVEEAISD